MIAGMWVLGLVLPWVSKTIISVKERHLKSSCSHTLHHMLFYKMFFFWPFCFTRQFKSAKNGLVTWNISESYTEASLGLPLSLNVCLSRFGIPSSHYSYLDNGCNLSSKVMCQLSQQYWIWLLPHCLILDGYQFQSQATSGQVMQLNNKLFCVNQNYK